MRFKPASRQPVDPLLGPTCRPVTLQDLSDHASVTFDPSGGIDPDFGVTHEQIGSLSNTLDSLRTEMVEVDPGQYESGDIPENKRPLDARFFGFGAAIG